MPKRPRTNILRELVTYATSVEWPSDIFYRMADPDVLLRNTGQTVQVYNELLADAHVLACYQSRKAGVLNSEWKIEYPEGTESMAPFIDRMFADLDVDNIIAQILDAPFYGFSAMEVIWSAVGDRWVPVNVVQKPHEWFVFDMEGKLRFLSRKNPFDGELLPDFKFLVPRHFPTFKNPYGIRILSRTFWPVVFKKGAWKFMGIFLEKYGIPWLIGRAPRGSSREDLDEFLAKLVSMSQNAVAVITEGQEIEGLEMKASQGGNNGDTIFSICSRDANAEISKAILGQTLTTEIGNKGAYAASQSHQVVRTDFCSMDKKLVSLGFNLLIRWTCMFNFGSTERLPVFRFHEEEDAKEAHARRDTALTTQGVRFKDSYYVRTYNLRTGEFTVQEPTPPGPATDQEKEEKRKQKRLKEREDPEKRRKEKEE